MLDMCLKCCVELRFIYRTEMKTNMSSCQIFFSSMFNSTSRNVQETKKSNTQQFNTDMRHYCEAAHGQKHHSSINTLIMSNTWTTCFTSCTSVPCYLLLSSASVLHLSLQLWNNSIKLFKTAAAVCPADAVVCCPLRLSGGGGGGGGVCPAALQDCR